jgi:fucose 4-O-acetylase-like acetyltransferase
MTLTKTEVFDIVAILKAFAIIMVVFLHLQMGAENVLYCKINILLAPLRMPVFMFASGFLYIYVSKDKYPQYSHFVLEKFKRLIIPLFFIRISYCIIKLLISGFVSDEYAISPFHLKIFLQNLFLYPTNFQDANHLWFVYTLFVIFVIVHLFSSQLYLLTLFSFVVYFIRLPEIFGLNSIRLYMIFFCLGALLCKFVSLCKFKLCNINLLYIPLFLTFLLSIILFFLKQQMLQSLLQIVSFIQYLTGILFVVLLSTILALRCHNIVSQRLLHIGRFSATIYFLHTFCYRFFDILTSHLYSSNKPFELWIFLIMSLFVGINGPILIDKYLISKNELASLLLLGKRTGFANFPVRSIYREMKLRIQHRLY